MTGLSILTLKCRCSTSEEKREGGSNHKGWPWSEALSQCHAPLHTDSMSLFLRVRIPLLLRVMPELSLEDCLRIRPRVFPEHAKPQKGLPERERVQTYKRPAPASTREGTDWRNYLGSRVSMWAQVRARPVSKIKNRLPFLSLPGDQLQCCLLRGLP